ncbi:MAG: S8 family peptidase, partial [Gammaproteobacteria bacterium]|nr:S8 family peptidase [Gammaproteobacteria bacterium]
MFGKNFILVLGAACLLAGLDWSPSATEHENAKSRMFSVEAPKAINVQDVGFGRELEQEMDEQVVHVNFFADDNVSNEASKVNETRLSRLLWEDMPVPAVNAPLYLQPETLARYLWDDAPQRVQPKLSRLLWEDMPDTMTNTQLHRQDQLLARYLWNEHEWQGVESQKAVFGIDVADDLAWQSIYLETGSSLQLASVEQETGRSEPGASDELSSMVLMGREMSALLAHLDELNIEVDDQEDLLGAVVAKVSPVQLTQLSPEIVSTVVPDGQVVSAGLTYSIKGEPTLRFNQELVQWMLLNQGIEDIALTDLKFSWPQELGQPEALLVNGEKVSFSIVEPGKASLEAAEGAVEPTITRVAPEGTLELSIRFNQIPEQDENLFGFNAKFSNNLDLVFKPKNALPIQGMQRDSFFPTLIGADHLHRAGITGKGVGVAIIDTGSWDVPSISENTKGEDRVLAYYDAMQNDDQQRPTDVNGHGSHIASVLASSEKAFDENGQETGSYHGIAPDANLLVVKAFQEQSRSTYFDIIRAIAYVIRHKDEHNIKVMNLAFQGKPMSHYWQDPINVAVMAAWEAGITTVVSGGNSGPDPMTIGVPGNVPYVITVGAMTDHYTVDNQFDDYLAPFSSVGPTLEGFVKPEITAPGGHMMGRLPMQSTVANEHPEFHDGFDYYLMSGTSQAAAAASGVVALMLQKDPDLSPDDIKCRLMASASAAVLADGSLAYSQVQQGAGLINAEKAVASQARGCANQGLNLASDLAGRKHFSGPVKSFDVMEIDGRQDSDQVVSDRQVPKVGFTVPVEDIDNWLFAFNDNSEYQTEVLEENQFVWNAQDFAANGFNWDLEDLAANDSIWLFSEEQVKEFKQQQSVASVQRMRIDLPGNEDLGFNFDMAGVSPAGFIWNLSNPFNTGFIWNLSSPDNSGFIWNLASPDNSGFIWNLSSPDNSGFIWNLSSPDNSGFIWNLASPENAG